MTAATAERFDWRPIVYCWLFVLVIAWLPQIMHSGGIPPFTDDDDVLRMVMATDLANGQAWQDETEYRDDAPYGTPMHWSRLVDAPIAAIIVATRPFLGTFAGDLAAYAWPPLMLLLLLTLSVGLCRQILGPGHQWAAAILPILSIVVLNEFTPGRVDHHNVQMLLTTGLMWATIAGRTNPRAAIGAGVLAATSLAIGLETLPFLVGSIVVFALFWVLDAGAAGNARRFAIALVLATVGHLVLAVPPSHYFVAHCDELSDTYVLATALAGGAIILATYVGGRLSPWQRLLLVAVLGGLAGAATLVAFPECRGGPYAALSPRALDLLVTHNHEAEPLWTWLARDPAGAFGYVTTSFVGLGLLVWLVATTRGPRRTDWLVLLVYMVLATAVLLDQTRGLRLAIMPVIPAGVWLVGQARAAYAAHRGGWRAAGVAVSWLLFAGLAQLAGKAFLVSLTPPTLAASASSFEAAAFAYHRCIDATGAFKELARLPPGVVIDQMSLGARILHFTHDSVVSAGYHRNVDGSFDVDDFLNAGEAAAKSVVLKRGVRYVVACRGVNTLEMGAKPQAGSFMALWRQNQHWDWLKPVSNPTDLLQIFEVNLQP